MRRHETDVVSLVAGLFFLGAALIWGLTGAGGLQMRSWALPTLLIAVGAVGLLSSLTGRRSRRGEPDTEAGTEPAAAPAPDRDAP